MKNLIKSLDKLSFDAIYTAFHEAFCDYEMQLSQDELYRMLNRRGFVPELSFAAFHDDQIIAFTLNGIGSYNGIKTAYDTGTGTIKEYRGQGLATEIFNYSIPFLKKAGVSQYLLEVLQHNTKAVSVYRKLGFITSREFNYFVQKKIDIKLVNKVPDKQFHVKQIDFPEKKITSELWDFTPSWQNNHEAISRAKDDFICFGAFKGPQLIGYCIFEQNSGDITHIAVDKNFRRMGIASSLFEKTLSLNRNENVKIINTEVNCKSITGFLEANSIPVTGQQFEMIKKI